MRGSYRPRAYDQRAIAVPRYISPGEQFLQAQLDLYNSTVGPRLDEVVKGAKYYLTQHPRLDKLVQHATQTLDTVRSWSNSAVTYITDYFDGKGSNSMYKRKGKKKKRRGSNVIEGTSGHLEVDRAALRSGVLDPNLNKVDMLLKGVPDNSPTKVSGRPNTNGMDWSEARSAYRAWREANRRRGR